MTAQNISQRRDGKHHKSQEVKLLKSDEELRQEYIKI